MQHSRRYSFTRSALAAGSVLAATSLVLAGCGSRAGDEGAANAESCVDTSGDTIKVGALNSLSGTMAISEVTVRNAIDLAVEQINADGGVMGKQIQLVAEDGASEPAVFAEKAQKLISSKDEALDLSFTVSRIVRGACLGSSGVGSSARQRTWIFP